MRFSLAFIACLQPVVAAVAVGATPNVLVVITGDQGFGDFSTHGNPHLATPHLAATLVRGAAPEPTQGCISDVRDTTPGSPTSYRGEPLAG